MYKLRPTRRIALISARVEQSQRTLDLFRLCVTMRAFVYYIQISFFQVLNVAESNFALHWPVAFFSQCITQAYYIKLPNKISFL